MASFRDGGEGKSAQSPLQDEEEVALDQDFDYEDDTYRQMPGPTFPVDSREMPVEHFSVHDLEDSVMRSVAGSSSSSGYHMRSVSLAGRSQQPSFGVVQPFSMANTSAKPGAKAMGLTAEMFASASASNQSFVPEPPLLPPSPFFLDRNSFDLSRSVISAGQLHTDLLKTFDEAAVDFVWKPEKWKFACKAYPNNEPVDFRVRLYSRPDGDTYALEFQQRDGCRFSYQSLLNRLKKRLHLSANAKRPAVPFNTFVGNPQGATSKSDIAAVVGMVNSDFADVQREGLKILCRFTQIKQSGEMLVGTDAISSTLRCLRKCGSDVEIRRVAGMLLTHFVKCYDLPEALKRGKVVADKQGLFIDIVDAAVDLTRSVSKAASGSSALNTGFGSLPEPKYVGLSRLEVRRVGAGLLCVLARWPEARKRIKANGGEDILSGIIQEQTPDRRLREYAQDCTLCLHSM